MSQIINESQYKEVTQQGKVVIQFTAGWCGPCRNIKRVLEENSQSFGYEYLLVDIEKDQDLAKSKGVKSIPFVEIYSSGEKKHEFVGSKTPSQIKDIFGSIF